MARTVVEIGRLAGCSGATVSRALNNSGSVSAATRAAVLKVLHDTQYSPRRSVRRSPEARRAQQGGAGLIEVILHRQEAMEPLIMSQEGLTVGPLSAVSESDLLSGPYHLASSFYRQVVDGAVEELSRWNRRVVLQNSTELLSPRLLSELNSPDRDGVLLLGERVPSLAQFVERCRHPVVLVDIIHDGQQDVVTSDNLAGITAAFEHLYSLGHRKIGFVGKLDSNIVFVERFTAYRLAMVSKGLDYRPDWIYEGNNHIDTAAAGVQTILAKTDRPTAFVCVNDCAALSVVRAASACGISIPSELSVVGFDDEESAALVTPPLTTMRVPMAEMGRQAVRQLMIQIQGGPIDRRQGCRVRLQPELIIRQSTSRIAE